MDDLPAVVSLVQIIAAALLLHIVPAGEGSVFSSLCCEMFFLLSRWNKTDSPGKVILKDPHEDDDDEAEQQHHKHQ